MKYAFIVNPASGQGKHDGGIVPEIDDLIKGNPNRDIKLYYTRGEKDATYLRVKNVELAFHIPSEWLKNVTLDKAKVYFSTYNPFTWSHLNAYNVDAEDWLAGQIRYFRTRTFNIGVDLTF